MQDAWSRSVPCRDGFDREKYTQVVITDKYDVAVIPPPGGGLVLHPGDVPRLQQALTDAQIEAVHRRGVSR